MIRLLARDNRPGSFHLMLKKHLLAGGIGLGLLATQVAPAAVLHFDDLTTTSWESLPPAYGGFEWSPDPGDFEFVAKNCYQFDYGNVLIEFPSGSSAVYNGDGAVTVVVSSQTPFRFIGADFAYWSEFSGFSAVASSRSVTVNGYLGGQLVGSATMPLGPTFRTLEAQFARVDRLEFLNDGKTRHFWLLDNFTYAPAPETRKDADHRQRKPQSE